MSSMVVGEGRDKGSKKRKKKYASPFRIKVGCLVALRYQSRGNRISVLMPERDSSTSSGDGTSEESCNSYQEPVTSAQFSEVWTDPRRDRDSGLALIGSRIRCFFPKAILSEPYNAANRLLEGIVVNVVRDSEKQSSQQRLSSKSSSFMVDLLVDNKDNKTLSVTLPFLKRVDSDGQSDGKMLKESEQRRRQYEERIKGGKHKAVVRISLSNSSFSHAGRPGRNPLEAKWVIRKRVPTKIFRRELPLITDSNIDDKEEEERQRIDNADGAESGENGHNNVQDSNENNGEKKAVITSPTSEALPESPTKKKQQKREANGSTSFNKDFSLPRYVGDGNDSTSQQEGNWRWEAGRYHNPHSVALSDRPISKSLLEKLSYNFVGEVVSIHPTRTLQSKDSTIDTLAMVTIRLLVLPEHTQSGRLAHHGPLDLFECEDLDAMEGGLKGTKLQYTSDSSEKQRGDGEGGVNNGNNMKPKCLLHVPIEELVIVEKNISRGLFDSNKKPKIEKGEEGMTIEHSYSFLNDMYSLCEAEERALENMDDDVEHEKSGRHVCRRCRHLSETSKRLAGIPSPLCQSCFEFIKVSNAARLGPKQKSKSKIYQCDEHFCVERKNTDLLVRLGDEVMESESKLGSTLEELEDYAGDTDSGFIATRFILKGLNPVDFSISPFSLASFINSAPSKPVTKVKSRISRGAKKSNSKNTDGLKRNGNKSPTRNAGSSRDQGMFSRIITKNEPFRSTSARLLPYDVSNRKFDVSASELYQWKIFRSSISPFPEKPRNLRQHRKLDSGEDSVRENSGKKKLQGRAARAKQRRLLRGATALGVDVDILAGRERNVRFERSNIHGWGVFSDIDVKQGEMIIEYRGELIGNAMAEKREKEYEAAKIGSDYMFRIDEYTVCDASKQGNVARFINASCSPNCYPKIILLDGTKRVAVYSKRDIRAGEELTYDYKFDLEFDPAKRIPCICGSPECKGFLNWDQRYVALPTGAATANSDATKNNSNDKLV